MGADVSVSVIASVIVMVSAGGRDGRRACMRGFMGAGVGTFVRASVAAD